jgi:hypothetical protein
VNKNRPGKNISAPPNTIPQPRISRYDTTGPYRLYQQPLIVR